MENSNYCEYIASYNYIVDTYKTWWTWNFYLFNKCEEKIIAFSEIPFR